MNVQSLNCQPIRPVYQLNSKPSFGNEYDNDYDFRYDEGDTEDNFTLENLRQERNDYEMMAKNKDSKFLSSVGTFGLGVAAGAASFLTFKTMAPKGARTLKTMYSKVANLGFVKKSVAFVKKYASKAANTVKGWVNSIKPDSKLGKVKTYLSDKISLVSGKVKTAVSNFAKKHNMDKEFAKKAANNTGATLVAIPAATTAINSSLTDKNGGIE